jgi:hypothetical protein
MVLQNISNVEKLQKEEMCSCNWERTWKRELVHVDGVRLHL